MTKFLRSIRSDAFRGLSLGALLLLAVACIQSGCGKPRAPSPSPAPLTTNATSTMSASAAPKAGSAVASTNPVSGPSPGETIQALVEPFASAPPETRARVEQAVTSFQAGKKREAMTQLKLIDADTALTGEQQDSIKEMIRQMRK